MGTIKIAMGIDKVYVVVTGNNVIFNSCIHDKDTAEIELSFAKSVGNVNVKVLTLKDYIRSLRV